MRWISGPAVCLIVLIGLAFQARAESEIVTEAPDWCANAQQYLRKQNGAAFDCAKASRCIKLNNYGCSQNHSGTPFPGQLTTSEGKPVHDPQKHVAYEHPKWSLAKSIGTLLRYQTSGKKSALAIAETYAPWCDTRGSKIKNGEWGRACSDSLPSVPASYAPRCAKPASGQPSRLQCDHCNCPNLMAAFYIRGVINSVSDPIPLFDVSRKPTPLMSKFLPRVSTLETGYVPSDPLIADAISSFNP